MTSFLLLLVYPCSASRSLPELTSGKKGGDVLGDGGEERLVKERGREDYGEMMAEVAAQRKLLEAQQRRRDEEEVMRRPLWCNFKPPLYLYTCTLYIHVPLYLSLSLSLSLLSPLYPSANIHKC